MYEKSKIPFSYMLCLFCKEPIGKLNLKRALDEDTGVFSPFFHLLHWVREPFLGIPPFISDPGSLFIMIFCESLALCAKSRGLIYTILAPKVK